MSNELGGLGVALAMIALLIIAFTHLAGWLPFEDAVVWSLVNIGSIIANKES